MANIVITDDPISVPGSAGDVSEHETNFDHSQLHVAGTDQGLDAGGPNAVTASEAKTAYAHSQASGNPHGTDADDIADGASNVMMTTAERSKLSGIEPGATGDQSNAEIETGYNQQVAQVSVAEKTAGTETAVRRYSPKDIADMAGTHGAGGSGIWGGITGTLSDQTDLQAALDAKADSTALHTQGTDQGLDTGGPNAVTAAEAKTAHTHSQATGNPHGATAADVGAETSSQLDARDVANRSRSNHTGEQAISTITGLQDALDAATQPADPDIPAVVLDENALFGTEADAAGDFSTVIGTWSIVGSELVLDTASQSAVLSTFTITPPSQHDHLYYMKMRADVSAGEYGYLNLRSSGTIIASLIMNYNWTTSTAELGTVSIYANGGTYTRVLETGVDTSAPREYVMHVDRDRSAVSIYLRDGDGYTLLNTFPYFAGMLSINELYFAQGGGSGSNYQEQALDYFTLAAPNFLSIGDSITAGHNYFDPDPDFYAGVDNSKNSYQGYLNYTGLRNNFVINKGIGAQDTGEVLARIAEATNPAPKYVFLSACNNDYEASITLSQRTTNIQSMIDAINTAGSRCVLLNAIYPNANHAQYPTGSDYYVDWWDTYRSTLTGIYQEIDLMQPVIDGSTGYIDTTYCESDGIHPNVAGYALIGAYIDAQFIHSDTYGLLHLQGTDQGLDTGGPNAVTAAEAKAGYTHSTTIGNTHNMTAVQAGSGVQAAGDAAVADGTGGMQWSSATDKMILSSATFEYRGVETSMLFTDTVIASDSTGMTIMGYQAGGTAAALLDQTCFGRASGSGSASSNITFVGATAGELNNGDNTVGIGDAAAKDNTGANCLAFGVTALQSNTGDFVVGMGSRACRNNATAGSTAVGYQALQDNTGGVNPASLGRNAGFANAGDGLAVLGAYAGQNNAGAYCSGIGKDALRDNIGDNVTAVGYKAGQNNTAANCLFVGPEIGNGNSVPNSFAIGTQATNPIVEGVNTTSPATSTYKVNAADVNFANLPTTDPAVAGQLWNDAGTMKISAG